MGRVWLLVALAGCRFDLDAVDRPGGDGGAADAADDGAVSDEPNVVFVSSVERAPPDLGGIEGADALCQELAGDAGLPEGTYRAWLSSSGDGIDARDRLGDARGWVRPDQLPFADTVSDLLAGRIFYPAGLDEEGTDRTGGLIGALVATGTGEDGRATGEDCGGFRSNEGALRFGRGDGGAVLWTAADQLNCTTNMHVYCFGTGRAHELEPPPEADRLAFLTADPFEVGGGIDGADSACAADALAAGLGGRTFRALVATSEASAISRFDVSSSRPWHRVDGVRVSHDFADLTAPLEVTAAGDEHVSGLVFTGALLADQIGTDTCTDWSDNTGGQNAQTGQSARSTAEAFGGAGLVPCDTPARLYCLEL